MELATHGIIVGADQRDVPPDFKGTPLLSRDVGISAAARQHLFFVDHAVTHDLHIYSYVRIHSSTVRPQITITRYVCKNVTKPY